MPPRMRSGIRRSAPTSRTTGPATARAITNPMTKTNALRPRMMGNRASLSTTFKKPATRTTTQNDNRPNKEQREHGEKFEHFRILLMMITQLSSKKFRNPGLKIGPRSPDVPSLTMLGTRWSVVSPHRGPNHCQRGHSRAMPFRKSGRSRRDTASRSVSASNALPTAS